VAERLGRANPALPALELSRSGDVATVSVAVTSPSETPIAGRPTGNGFLHGEQMLAA